MHRVGMFARGSSETWTDLEVQPWIAEFLITVALVLYFLPFSWMSRVIHILLTFPLLPSRGFLFLLCKI